MEGGDSQALGRRSGPTEHAQETVARFGVDHERFVLPVFDFDSQQSLSFQIDESGQLLSVHADIYDLSGKKLLEIRQSTTTDVAEEVSLEQRPGRLRVAVDNWQRLLPPWAYNQLLRHSPADVAAELPLFDIDVVREGVVRVAGIWSSGRRSVVITNSAFIFLTSSGPPRYPSRVKAKQPSFTSTDQASSLVWRNVLGLELRHDHAIIDNRTGLILEILPRPPRAHLFGALNSW